MNWVPRGMRPFTIYEIFIHQTPVAPNHSRGYIFVGISVGYILGSRVHMVVTLCCTPRPYLYWQLCEEALFVVGSSNVYTL